MNLSTNEFEHRLRERLKQLDDGRRLGFFGSWARYAAVRRQLRTEYDRDGIRVMPEVCARER